MAFDSHRTKPSSEIVGTRPVGLRERYSSSWVPPKSPPASWRRNGISSSSQHQSTFCTLYEFFLPQTSSIRGPLSPSSARPFNHDTFLRCLQATRMCYPAGHPSYRACSAVYFPSSAVLHDVAEVSALAQLLSATSLVCRLEMSVWEALL